MIKKIENIFAWHLLFCLMNERFGTHFTENDLYFIRAIGEDMLLDETLGHQAVSNTIENFKYGFENMFMDTVIKRREMNENMFARIMDDTGIREFVMSHLLPWVYRRLRENSTARKD
jgi:type I restriction enzyme R subunit